MILKNPLKRGTFYQAPKMAINDTRISHGAFRLLSYLFDKHDGWGVNNSHIKEDLGIKDPKTIARYWDELTKTGWLSRIKRKNDDGQFIGGFDVELNINPYLGNDPNWEKPLIRQNTSLGKMHHHINNDSIINNDTTINTKLFERVLKYYEIELSFLPQPKKITDSRKKMVMARIKEHGIETVISAMQITLSSDFLSGRKNDFKANFDFIFNKANFLKIIEGNYSNDKSNGYKPLLNR